MHQHIFVFKTSVKTKKHVKQLRPLLTELLKQSKWNFDLEDCDKILRINSETAEPPSVIKLLQSAGFECEELTH